MLLFGTTKLFDKDLDLVEKRGKDIQKLEQIIQSLVWEEVLPQRLHDHPLKGNWKNHRELHIEPDWLLIYKKTSKEIIAVRTGTHSDLFYSIHFLYLGKRI